MHHYEQVDHPSNKAVTFTFGTNGGRDRGGVTGPTEVIFDQQMAPRIPQPGSLTPTKAFAMAEELADQLGLPLVVVDPNGIWNPVWGELYRSTGPRAGWHERDAGLKPTAVLLKMVPVGQRVVAAWGLTDQFPTRDGSKGMANCLMI